MIDKLKAMISELEDNERGAIFEAAHSIGEAVGRKQQVFDLIKKLEEDRKVVDIGGKKVETTAKGSAPEKR